MSSEPITKLRLQSVSRGAYCAVDPPLPRFRLGEVVGDGLVQRHHAHQVRFDTHIAWTLGEGPVDNPHIYRLQAEVCLVAEAVYYRWSGSGVAVSKASDVPEPARFRLMYRVAHELRALHPGVRWGLLREKPPAAPVVPCERCQKREVMMAVIQRLRGHDGRDRVVSSALLCDKCYADLPGGGLRRSLDSQDNSPYLENQQASGYKTSNGAVSDT